MQTFVLDHETGIRLAAFLAVFFIMTTAELVSPRRKAIERKKRWPLNMSMVLIGTLAIRALVPLVAVEAALEAKDQSFGLFNQMGLPFWLEVIAGLLLLDLAIYAQHVIFHHVPWLWRIHRMHHSDLQLDVTSGVRFHPVELLLSMAIKVGVVSLLGISALAVILFEVILNASAMFNHSNLRLPTGLDRFLRAFLVTPDFHVVHHSVIRAEHNRNFGFNLPWWDYIFGTYKPFPEKGVAEMEIGLSAWRSPEQLGLVKLLWMPFRPDKTRLKKLSTTDGS